MQFSFNTIYTTPSVHTKFDPLRFPIVSKDDASSEPIDNNDDHSYNETDSHVLQSDYDSSSSPSHLSDVQSQTSSNSSNPAYNAQINDNLSSHYTNIDTSYENVPLYDLVMMMNGGNCHNDTNDDDDDDNHGQMEVDLQSQSSVSDSETQKSTNNDNGDEPTTHKCPFCDNTFQQKSNLDTHVMTHSKDPSISHPFRCHLCLKSGKQRVFTRKSSLKRHCQTKHRNVDVTSQKWINEQKIPKWNHQLSTFTFNNKIPRRYRLKNDNKNGNESNTITNVLNIKKEQGVNDDLKGNDLDDCVDDCVDDDANAMTTPFPWNHCDSMLFPCNDWDNSFPFPLNLNNYREQTGIDDVNNFDIGFTTGFNSDFIINDEAILDNSLLCLDSGFTFE